MHRFRAILWCAAIVSSLCLSAGPLRGGELKERFLTEGLASLRDLEQFSMTLQARIQRDVLRNGVEDPDPIVHEGHFQGSWQLDILTPRPELPDDLKQKIFAEKIRGVNSRYGFELERKRLDLPYHLTKLEKIGKGPLNAGPNLRYYRQSLFTSWILHLRPFHEWLKIDGFSLESVEEVMVQETRLAKVRAKYTGAKQANNPDDPDVGFDAEVLLDPGDHWCVREARYRVRAKGQDGAYVLGKHVTLEYGPRIEGMPVPIVVTDRMEFPREHKSFVGTVAYKYQIGNAQKTVETAESEFAAERFGIPAVFGAPRTKKLTGPLLIAVGVLALIAALALGWRKGKFWKRS